MPLLGRPRKQVVRHHARIGRRNLALVASAERAQDSEGALLRLNQLWQNRAMRIYRTQGECANPAQYQARAMERIRYYPAVLDKRGVPVESDDATLLELFNRIRTPNGAPGDLSELAGSYARLQFVIGDGLLTVSMQFGEEAWEYLSPMELRLLPGGDASNPQDYLRLKAPGIQPEQLVEAPDADFEPVGDEARVWRLWRRDIEFCADSETEILTERGWVRHGDLRPGTRVLTLNHDSGLSEWQPALAVNRFEVENEDMVLIDGRDHSSLTTLDHRWPTIHCRRFPEHPGHLETKRHWTTSENLNSLDRIITAAPCADLPTEPSFPDHLVEAVAWFYTEGEIRRTGSTGRELIGISQSAAANPIYVRRIRGALTNLYGEPSTERMNVGSKTLPTPMWRERSYDGETINFWLNTAASAVLLEIAPDKIVSLDFIRSLTLEQLDLFIETSIDADGHRTENGTGILAQKDARRLDAFEFACVLAGRMPRRTVGNHVYQTRRGFYTMTRITAFQKDYCALQNSDRKLGPRGRCAHPRRSQYTGTVWCPTTQNGTWLARRRGTVYFTGNSQWAYSPVRPCIEDYELLARLTLAVAAEASSRAAQRGLLYVPDELSFGPADPTQEENPDEDPLISEMQQAYARAIQNPGSAEAMAPFIMRGPGTLQTSGGVTPMVDCLKWIPLGPGNDYHELPAWDATISRIAGSIDMPKELMTGVGDVSHWGQWFLDDIGFRQHTGPTVTRFCADLGAAYLRPAAIEAGIDNADRVTVWFDPSDAVNHPDETGTVLKAHSQLIVSDAYAREKIGAPDTAAPGEEELKRRTEVLLKQNPYADGQDPRNGNEGETAPTAGGRGGDTSQAPPADSQTRPSGAAPPSPAPNLTAKMLVARLEGAAMMSVDRAREIAGNRLARRAQACEECRPTVAATPRALLAAALGPEQVRSVIDGHCTEPDLVDGVGKAFAARLVAWDVNGGWPEQLGQMVEQHARRTLYEQEVPPLPPAFLAACQKAVANGGET